MKHPFKPLHSAAAAFRGLAAWSNPSFFRSLLVMLALSYILLPGQSRAQDADNDGITDTIDPNPGLTNPKLTRTGTVPVAYTMQILGSGRVASIQNSTLFTGTNNGAENGVPA